ncbi:MAG: metallophosphoesterase [Chitinophagaceae bacterium]|nr:metallophosphoesterase [Chitinophagaceae bacterium]MCW5927104.1 metallophosphoesterase [Chitinophagaceae bacterium]
MRRFTGSWILIIVMLLIDLYVFQALKLVLQSVSPKIKIFVFGAYWTLSVGAIVLLAILPFINFESWPKSLRTYTLAILIGMFLSKAITAIFLLVDDLRRVLQWLGGRLFYQYIHKEPFKAAGISRSVFLSWIGLAAGGSLMSAFIWGFTNKYNYQLKKVKLQFPNLPPAFSGLKIIHISDIHSGSFNDRSAVARGVKTILDQQADIILFTGDIVNDHTAEMVPYKDIFSRLQAPMGVFSTLGNHDYGEYRRWESEEAKAKNLEDLKTLQKEMGWRLLMNEHVVLEKDGQEIALIGVENWGAKANFPRYGKLDEAYAGAEKYAFKILMTHDPSHWDAQVRPEYSDIDLTLSGHTHGMQFGVEIPWFKWSPVQYVYKQWAGLYEEANQKLYINRGYGFIGYPGRVGILPEITVIELA